MYTIYSTYNQPTFSQSLLKKLFLQVNGTEYIKGLWKSIWKAWNME